MRPNLSLLLEQRLPNRPPTRVQALLDVYTIQREIGRLDNFKIGLIGDLVRACAGLGSGP